MWQSCDKVMKLIVVLDLLFNKIFFSTQKKKKEKKKIKINTLRKEEEVDQATHGSLGDQVNPLNKRFF